MLKLSFQFSDEETVALVIGGAGNPGVELYTPDGSCVGNIASPPLPTGYINYITNNIIACDGSGNTTCWKYNVTEDMWTNFTQSSFPHIYQTSEVFNDKLYFVDDLNPEVFDPATNTWSLWPAPPAQSGNGPCLVTYQDSFLMFGGTTNSRGAQQFNHTANEWVNLNPVSVPNDMINSGCILLPNGQDVLIVGSLIDPVQSAASIYTVQSNTFTELPDTDINRAGTSLVRFGSRIFVIDGQGGNKVEEFNYDSNTWTSGFADLREWRQGHQAVVTLPKVIFQKNVYGCTSKVN